MSEPRTADRAQRRLWAVWGVVGISALLALAAIASRAHAPRIGEQAPAAQPPQVVADYLATLALLMVPLGAVLLVWSMFQRRAAQAGAQSDWRSTLRSLILFGLLLGLAFWASGHFHGRDRTPSLTTVPTVTQPQPGPAGKKQKPEPTPLKAHFRWLPLLVLGSLALGLAVAVAGAAARRRRLLAGGELSTAAIVAEVLADTLDDLRAEQDPRRAVIRAYARMERTLSAHGLPRHPFEAPFEYLERILAMVEASSYSVRRLTQLFERARFSVHAVDARMKAEAIEALVALRAELLAPA